jgi:hypothetical protein
MGCETMAPLASLQTVPKGQDFRQKEILPVLSQSENGKSQISLDAGSLCVMKTEWPICFFV